MAENTKQARWIFMLYGNLLALFAEVADVFIAADNFWYPVEGEPKIRQAPDVYVVFGRPKGDRGSYKQWEEGGVAPQVVFEILSPSNDPIEMADKFDWYERFGVEEYYIYDPDRNRLVVYARRGEVLRRVHPADGHVSPRLKIRFQMTAPEMTVYRPDGRPFVAFDQLEAERVREAEAHRQAVERADKAEEALRGAEAELERLRRLLDARGQNGGQA
jgi:Uma2 family endonuclease